MGDESPLLFLSYYRYAIHLGRVLGHTRGHVPCKGPVVLMVVHVVVLSAVVSSGPRSCVRTQSLHYTARLSLCTLCLLVFLTLAPTCGRPSLIIRIL